jgi:fumarate reductase subunit C
VFVVVSLHQAGETAREISMNVRLYVLQRATAMIMAPLVLAHLFVIFYATSRGLSAAEVLGRTRGSLGWGLFYGLFVLAAATHGAIGVRVVASEWLGMRGGVLGVVMWGFGLALAGLGLRAVAAVVL